ncbi:unnamed protein product [Caenorhabditis bovis]|uniref:Uncharacterized protein n=1 Tax=Caenorhabditis bovis TaxID=2654633 RepID=A0A8S1ESH9_9PELO|nr:unnamed protein product [Caenorhabditis bovis]
MTSTGNKANICDELDNLVGGQDLESLNKVLKRIDDVDLDSNPAKIRSGILRRKGEWLYALSNYEADKKKRVEILERAYEAAKQAHDIDDTDFEICKVLCSTSGRLAEESQLKKKLHYGFLFKNYLDKAIAIDGNDFEALHMRGRFCYTVANLSMVELLAARMIGSVPDVSFQDALTDLLKADSIISDVAENQLFIGKTYLALNDIPNAKKWLQMAAENTTDMAVEQEHVEEAQELLKDRRFK